MKKIELKHYAAYLPYNVKVQRNNIEKKIVVLTPSNFDFNLLNNNKLILRPLSDLTKKIEHNEEKFIPIERLFSPAEYEYFPIIKFSFFNGVLNEIWLQNKKCSISESILTFYDWNLLLSWNFDIYNLIENDLAIDINSLQNQK